MKLISVVIPCCNEEAVLPQLFAQLTAAATAWELDYEVICVDDGSGDRTWELLAAQHRADAHWRGVALARNFGHQAAVSAGLWHARGDAVVVMDADLQDPPEVLPRLLEQWRAGFQVVHAVRASRRDGLVKRSLAWAFYRLMGRLVSFDLPADAGDFCLLDRRVVDLLNAMPERSRFLRGLRAWVGFRQTRVEFQRDARAAGLPQYTFKKSLRLALDGLFSFSTAPLRLASYLGLVVSCLALAGVGFTLCQRVFRSYFESIGLGPGPGFATIVISILFLGGVQLICLGIIGEYLGRVYEEVKGRPVWIVRETLGGAPPPPAPGGLGAPRVS